MGVECSSRAHRCGIPQPVAVNSRGSCSTRWHPKCSRRSSIARRWAGAAERLCLGRDIGSTRSRFNPAATLGASDGTTPRWVRNSAPTVSRLQQWAPSRRSVVIPVIATLRTVQVDFRFR